MPRQWAIDRVGFVRGSLHLIAIDYVATKGDHHATTDENAQDVSRLATQVSPPV